MFRLLQISLPVVLAGLVAGAPLAAVRAAEAPGPSAVVPAGDLDLAAASGRAALRRRVKLAAKRLCEEADAEAAIGTDAYDACVQQAIFDAAPQMSAMFARAGRNRETVLAAAPPR